MSQSEHHSSNADSPSRPPAPLLATTRNGIRGAGGGGGCRSRSIDRDPFFLHTRPKRPWIDRRRGHAAPRVAAAPGSQIHSNKKMRTRDRIESVLGTFWAIFKQRSAFSLNQPTPAAVHVVVAASFFWWLKARARAT